MSFMWTGWYYRWTTSLATTTEVKATWLDLVLTILIKYITEEHLLCPSKWTHNLWPAWAAMLTGTIEEVPILTSSLGLLLEAQMRMMTLWMREMLMKWQSLLHITLLPWLVSLLVSKVVVEPQVCISSYSLLCYLWLYIFFFYCGEQMGRVFT